MTEGLPTTYPDPVHIAIIGGTGLRALPSLTAVAALHVPTPWGEPSSPITILHHADPSNSTPSAKPTPIAFLARHGPHHSLAPHEVPSRANVAALRHIGVRCVLAFSAVGSLQEAVAPRDFVAPSQLIDRTKGVRPWTFFEAGVVAHVGFADPFDEAFRALIVRAARAGPTTLHDGGTLVCMEGPQFSTRAESNLYRAWGGAVINMSALPEAKLAREAEMAYAMVCMATDYDCWRGGGDVNVEMVMGHMRANADAAKRLVGDVLLELGRPGNERIVTGEQWRGATTGSAGMTAVEARGKDTVEKLRWLFPGCF